LVCDFASIEARVLAWVAGQEDLLQAFRDRADAYKAMAAKIYEVPPEDVSKAQRQVGKVAILGLGYGMGPPKFVDAVKLMARIDISHTLAHQVVKVYRNANDQIAKLWGQVERGAVEAIQTGENQQVGRLEFSSTPDWLKIKLPSGRHLHYRKPRLVEVVAPWSAGYSADVIATSSQEEFLLSIGVGLGERNVDVLVGCRVPATALRTVKECFKTKRIEKKPPRKILQIEFDSVNSVTRKWGPSRTYGAKLVENIVQAVSRDFLVSAMYRVENAGYLVVGSVHDEVLAEVPDGSGSLEEFEELMRAVPSWGAGCPIDVEGYENRRYRK
jgi:DNA polymerase